MAVRGVDSLMFCYALCALCALYQVSASDLQVSPARLLVNASPQSQQKIPVTLFGIFFEEINHAGAGGLWAELVNNRGFEAGGPNTPSNFDPWGIIGDGSKIIVQTDRTSCFERNKIALRMDILCDKGESNSCPDTGVGVYNPGFWGMNIEQGKSYKVVLYMKSLQSVNISASLASSDGSQILASSTIIDSAPEWKKVELLLVSQGSNTNSRFQLTTSSKGIIWFDQVSVMPLDTYKGHGFRKELFSMIADIKPRFLRFPGS